MIGERKWDLVLSYEDATILIDNYKTNAVTKFSRRSSSFRNSSFSAQRDFYNQPAETFLKTKKMSL